jgi:hypothetical protein
MDMNDTPTSEASDLAAMLSSSILADDAEDPAASFIRPKDDEVLFGAGHVYMSCHLNIVHTAWPEWPESTAWPGAEDTLSMGSLDGGSAILVESDGTASSAVSTSSVISRLVAEKERLQTRVSVLEALAYSAATEEDLRASTTELPGRRAEQIQAMWRRALAVKQLRHTHMAAQAVQARLRGRSSRVAARRQGGAATVIQLAARWRQGARRCAARMIQRAVRRFHLWLAMQTKGALLRELLALRCEAVGLRQALDHAFGGASGGLLGGVSSAPAAASQAQAGAQAWEMDRRLAAAAATPAAGMQAEETALTAAVATAAAAAAAAAAARTAADARDWAQVESQAEAEAAEARDEALLRCALREACQLRVDNERLQHQKAEAEELASRLCAEGFLLRGRLEMLAAATAKAEETASFCVAARLQAAFDNEDNGGTTSERSCRRRAQ